MAATIGVTGQVTAASGTWNTLLARMSPASVTLTQTGGEADSTEFASSPPAIPRSYLPGLRTFGVSLEAYSATPVLGVTGGLAYAGAQYDTNIFDWELTLNQQVQETTDFAISAAWRTFTNGLQDWMGAYSGFIDGTTAIDNITEAAAAPTLGALTLTISSGNTLAGTVFTRSLSAAIRVDDRNIVRQEFRGSSNLTVVGTDAVLAANSGTMVVLPSGTMVITAATGRTYTGAFIPTSLNIRVAQGEITRIRASGQGTGALTIA